LQRLDYFAIKLLVHQKWLSPPDAMMPTRRSSGKSSINPDRRAEIEATRGLLIGRVFSMMGMMGLGPSA
jgi:hypothetical protein